MEKRKMFVARKCVKLYDNIWEIISQIKSKKAQKEVALATIQYAFCQKVDFSLSGIAYATFIGIKGVLDAAWRGYNNAKEKDNQDNKQELPTRQPNGQPMGLPYSQPQRQPNGQPDRLPPNSISKSISRREEKDKEEGEAEAEAEVGNRGEGGRTFFHASAEALPAGAGAAAEYRRRKNKSDTKEIYQTIALDSAKAMGCVDAAMLGGIKLLAAQFYDECNITKQWPPNPCTMIYDKVAEFLQGNETH